MGAIRAHDWLVHVRVDVSSGVLLRVHRACGCSRGGWVVFFIHSIRASAKSGQGHSHPPYLGLSTDLLLEP